MRTRGHLRPWNAQPTEPVGAAADDTALQVRPWVLLNWADGIRPPNWGPNAPAGLTWTLSSQCALAGSPSGRGLTNGSGGVVGAQFGANGSFDNMSPANAPVWTACSFTHRAYVSGDANAIFVYGSINSGAGFLAWVSTTNKLQAQAGNTSLTTTFDLVDGVTYNLVMGRDAGGACWLWINGALVASGTGATAAITTRDLYFAGDSTTAASGRAYPGVVSMFAMGADDIKYSGRTISENPWRLFAPRPVWPVFAKITSTDTPINPGAGTLTITGLAPTVAQSNNTSLTPGSGTLTITGWAPTVTQTSPPAFTGYSILGQDVVSGQAMQSYDVSSKFANCTTFTAVGSWPTGITVSSAGLISGTSSATPGAYTVQVQGNGTGSPALSNSFVITLLATGVEVARRSIGTAADYTTLQAWNNAAPANLVTSNLIWQGQCLNQEFVISGATHSPNYAIYINGSTTDATRYKHLTTAAGCSFRDNANRLTNALRYNASNGAAIRFTDTGSACLAITEIGARISNLQFYAGNGSTAGGYAAFTSQLGGTIIFENSIFESDESGVHNFVAAISGPHKCINSLFIARNTNGLIDTVCEFSAGVGLYSCGIVSVGSTATYGFTGGNNTGTAVSPVNCDHTNTWVFGCTNVRQWNSPGTRTNCYTDASSMPTGYTATTYDTTTGSGFQNITRGTHDFRIKSTSVLRDTGAVDSPNGAVDIVGTARGATYDVGPWEFTSTSTRTPAMGMMGIG